MPAWQPLAFLSLLVVLIVVYEVWAASHKGLTITEGMRALGKKARWFAVLVLVLDLFFLFHCFGRSLGVTN